MVDTRTSPSGPKIEVPVTLASILENGNDAEAQLIKNLGDAVALADAATLAQALATLGRYSVSGVAPGANRVPLGTTDPSLAPYPLSGGNTVVLPKGKYIAWMTGTVVSAAGNTYNLALQSTTGGAAMDIFQEVATSTTRKYALFGAWLAPADGEELWVFSNASPAAPTLTSCTLYVARLSDLSPA